MRADSTSSSLKLPSSLSTSSNTNLDYHAEPVSTKIESAIYTRHSPMNSNNNAEHLSESSKTNMESSIYTQHSPLSLENLTEPKRPLSKPPTGYLNAKNLKQKEICDFLSRMNLVKYKDIFLANGYDDINFIVSKNSINGRIQM
jgi:hypothetical protein